MRQQAPQAVPPNGWATARQQRHRQRTALHTVLILSKAAWVADTHKTLRPSHCSDAAK